MTIKQVEIYIKKISLRKLEVLLSLQDLTDEDINAIKRYYINHQDYEKATIVRNYAKTYKKQNLIIETDLIDRYGDNFIRQCFSADSESVVELIKKFSIINIRKLVNKELLKNTHHPYYYYFKRISEKRLNFILNLPEITIEDVQKLQSFYASRYDYNRAIKLRDFKNNMIKSGKSLGFEYTSNNYKKKSIDYNELWKKIENLNIKELFKNAKI